MEIYKDQSRSFEERAADLVSRMTLEEKVMQVGNSAAAIPRLGIPAYDYWSEASHGFFGPFEMKQMDVTSYPVCLAMSQSWDPEKMEYIAGKISDEIRAHHNLNGIELHMWCPTVNLARDPRNGRSDENFGEDPCLSGTMAAAYVRGMQGEGDHTKYLKCVATPKHFALNSSENNRHYGSSNVDEATLREYYVKPFEYAVSEGGAQSIMTSYNRINGIPASCNDMLLTTLLREEWGFNGFVVSDCGAVTDCYVNPMFAGEENLGHYYAKSMEEASAMTLEAGTDLSCGVEHKTSLLSAVEKGMISEDVIDRALIRVMTTRFRLGLLDDADRVPYNKIGKECICSEEMRKAAVDMADDTIVLLKNERNLLPVDRKKVKRILVVGPNAIYRQLGGYSAGQSPSVDTLVNVMALEGIQREAGSEIEVLYEKGWCTGLERTEQSGTELLPGFNLEDALSGMDGDMDSGLMNMLQALNNNVEKRHVPEDPDHNADDSILFARALEAAKDADLVIVIAGTDSSNASEEHDRESLELPYDQDEKIQKLLQANENTVVVLTSLGAVTGGFIEKAHTLVNAHFAGQEQGTAIADILFGKVNPNAKLTATWYKNVADLPNLNDYGLKKQDTYDRKARTYMYFDGPVLFPFGYGLSYTEYKYSNLQTDPENPDAMDTLNVSVDITNAGKMDGSEIVQIYLSKITDEDHRDNKPIRRLYGYKKVFVRAGETVTVHIPIKVTDISFWSNREKKFVVEEGTYRIEAGASSADIREAVTVHISGKWNAQLRTVYALADKYCYAPGEEGMLQVSAALDDCTHLNLLRFHPSFTSTDESVATVTDEGVIRAVGRGVCTIKVSVTYKEKTVSAFVPAAVR